MEQSDQKKEDLEEAARLEAAADGLTGAVRDEVLHEAAELREKWQAPADIVRLAVVSADLRDADLAEAARLEAVAGTLRPGSPARAAVESEAVALRAKWPDFSDDAEGQVLRLATYFLRQAGSAWNGVVPDDFVPARAALDRIFALEAKLAEVGARSTSCHSCGIPQATTGPGPVNTFAVAAVRAFETDGAFREQVVTGQVQPGQATHPWLPQAPPHKGPGASASPWPLSSLAAMIRGDERVAAEVGPKLRAALTDRGIGLPVSATSKSSTKALASQSN